MIVAAHEYQAEINRFVANGLWGDGRTFVLCQCMGWATETEGLVAGVVFHDWAPECGAIELSAYASRRDWLTKERLREIFAYPFEQLGCRLAVARIAESNTRARRVWRSLGATETAIPDLRAEGEAEIIAVLKAADWRRSRYMRSENG